MSPFSQLTTLGGNGYGNGIDKDFSPILNYIDEFDRHFSRRHRFVNCFIPRFDLEEDAHNYYLYGDVPGASVNDITVEAHDDHTLVIYGKTARTGPERKQDEETPGVEGADPFVKVQVDDHEHAAEVPVSEKPLPVRPEENQTAPSPASVTPFYPPPPTQATPNQAHPHHQRQSTFTAAPGTQNLHSDHRILLSERLVGDFHRTFAFPQPVIEDGVRASMENGVLSLVVPKMEKGKEVRKGRRVPIVHGNWWKGQEQGSGFGFASGAV